MSKQKLKPLLESIPLDSPFRAYIISRQGEIVVQRNDNVAMSYLERIAFRLSRTWKPESSTQIQFLQAELPANELIIFTCKLDDEYLLSVGAITETSIVLLREQAEHIVRTHLDVKVEENPDSSGVLLQRPVNGTQATCFAIVWQPQNELPMRLHTTLQQTLTQLAETNGCQLHHLAIQENYIQVLVACPPGRNSAWAAHLFKAGSEQGLQQRYHTESSLWLPGYYASETKKPLPAEELQRIFQNNRN